MCVYVCKRSALFFHALNYDVAPPSEDDTWFFGTAPVPETESHTHKQEINIKAIKYYIHTHTHTHTYPISHPLKSGKIVPNNSWLIMPLFPLDPHTHTHTHTSTKIKHSPSTHPAQPNLLTVFTRTSRGKACQCTDGVVKTWICSW